MASRTVSADSLFCGVTLTAEPVKAYSYPDDDALEACRELGKTIAEA